jgi:microcompartment protein CcmK/EutM
MMIGLVRGNVVATQKNEKLAGKKLLVVEPCDFEEKPAGRLKLTGRVIVAVDTVGAGEGEYVLVAKGTEDMVNSPADAVIVGIIDKVNLLGQSIELPDIKKV